MKKNVLFMLILIIGLIKVSYSQNDDPDKKFGIKWSGLIKVDYMFDTRQTVSAREGHFNLFPAAEVLDGDGDDINDQANFNILAVQSRLKGAISGPDFFGMKTSGVIEGAFFGHSNSDINGFRLRHAFVKLSNDKVDLIMGQYWHPMFVTAVFPGTYSFNTGVPFQPFSRNPQVRLTTKGKVKFTGVVFSERDFASRGPDGTTSKYTRNAGMPQVHAQLQFGDKKLLGGFGANLKTIRPVLGGDNLTSTAFIGFFKTKLNKVTLKLEGIYGENMSDLLMLSGIGEESNGDFTNNKTLSVWGEISGRKEKMEWGLFAGYTKNDGYNDPVSGNIYGLGGTIDNVLRIAPRIGWKSGKMKIGTELEYTMAQYGALDSNGTDISTTGIDDVSNVRLLVTAVYGF